MPISGNPDILDSGMPDLRRRQMDKELIEKIKLLKRKYDPEGFIILGVFGSYANGEETEGSDIDILYETNEVFDNKFKGLEYFGKIYDIKKNFEEMFNKEVDIADKNGLNRIGKKYILPEVYYVT
jgi:predicted nucleotidyltransferase